MTINVIQHDDRLGYLRPFYSGAFSIGQSMILTTSFFARDSTVGSTEFRTPICMSLKKTI
jgi:hypothetical protein